MKRFVISKTTIVILPLVLGIVMMLQGCRDEDLEGNYFTSTEEVIGEYIQNNPEKYSEYYKMLDTTGVIGLIKAYGLYTCFVPTNDAIKEYYASEGKSSIKDYSIDELKTFCYNHIIKGDTIKSSDFN